MIKIRVPGTSANVGPGFDAFGLALTIYNTFSFEEKSDGKLTIRGVDKKYQGTTNLVYRSMQKVFKKAGHHSKGLYIHSDVGIPISRGLGSSATCIVGGLFGANALIGSPLTTEELFDIAVEMEGHPDNVAPAIFGGLVVSLTDQGKNFYIKSEIHPTFEFYAIVPDFPLSTSDARQVLPKKINFSDATHNLPRATMTYLALVNGSEEILRVSMKDRLHQPYRKKLIAHYDVITRKARDMGCLNTCISGAGPTILAINSVNNPGFLNEMSVYLKEKVPGWQLIPLFPDNAGVQILRG
ncbi:homoserine kinase [Acetobacterium fimetarium]|uniref:Homoserine kinase n=1 Tax=Acetobacterium fimetarium TaxID=52691 RepID=A0ABR6WWV8_9FIRM|nr:homoserine kinase [Acetobacterium fimetarium]MBC3805114.1 homoserine kinase [Acetobacterium fimetarium]